LTPSPTCPSLGNAEELVRLNVDVIVAHFAILTAAAMAATHKGNPVSLRDRRRHARRYLPKVNLLDGIIFSEEEYIAVGQARRGVQGLPKCPASLLTDL